MKQAVMQVFEYPEAQLWPRIVQRPEADEDRLEAVVSKILREVKANGDEAIREFNRQFDNNFNSEFSVEIPPGDQLSNVPIELKEAIKLASKNIETFHRASAPKNVGIETSKGVFCESRSIPIQRVGLYIPGGTAPLFSTLLMLAIPAQIAGCEEIVVCTPPDKSGKLNEVIAYVCGELGIKKVYLVGGAQAIAGMAYGTETIPKVDKIFGPGNTYVTKAKQFVQLSGTAIDMPAGPSELLVVADAQCRADFVASDLLSQAEHGPDSQVILVLHEESGGLESFLESFQSELTLQLSLLARQDVAAKALEQSKILVFRSSAEAMEFTNVYAPEHLIIASAKFEVLAAKVRNAGSVFLGPWSCESAGDYASGTNHTLPTAGFARSYSGVSVESFMKKISFQTLNAEGIKSIGTAVETMATFEGLQAHATAMKIRINTLSDV